MRTATEILLERASALRDALTELLDRSGITQMEHDWGSAVWLGPTGEWAELDVEAQRLQSRILGFSTASASPSPGLAEPSMYRSVRCAVGRAPRRFSGARQES